MRSTFILAQSASDAAEQTTNQTRELLTDITTWKVTQALIIIAVAYLAVVLIEKLINWFSERVNREWRLGIKQSLPFCRTVVLTAAGVTLLNLFFNLSQENLLALTGTVAVALGFAFKDYASSVIAGLIGLFEAPYQVGDRIQIGEQYGEVVNYGLRGIRLITPTDNLVTIPHNKIWTEAVSNANTGKLEAQVVTEFYLAHEIDLDLAIHVLYRVAYTSKYTQIKLPVVVIAQEKPWGILLKLKSYPMDARDEFVYQTDLLKRAKKVFARYHFSYPRLIGQDSQSQS
jgi:small-conductance mechanosensitive channel